MKRGLDEVILLQCSNHRVGTHGRIGAFFLFPIPMISLARYGTLLARPNVRRVLIASLVGRFPIGVSGLSILLLAQATSGSFIRGGAASAAYVVGLASASPFLGRLIDRSGPVEVLLCCALAFPAALGSLVLAAQGHASPLPTYALAFCAGASFPPITVCMRTFFRRELGEHSMLATAYSLESVLIETIFIVGPMLVAFFLAVASPSAAVLFAALCASLGTVMFVRSPALRAWHIEARVRRSWLGPLAECGFAPLLAVVLAYSAAFGLVEIGVTAYATEIERPALAGVMLGLMSAGSAAGGLAYGSRDWRSPLARQFVALLCALGVGVALLALASNIWLFALLSVAAGIVMAPTLTVQTMLVSHVASAQHATEAFTWSSTGLLIGVGFGIAAGGWLIERWGFGSTFLAAAIVSLCAGALATKLRAPS